MMDFPADIISFDPQIRMLERLLDLKRHLEPFTYNGHPFFYCSDREGKHLVWKDGQDKNSIHELHLNTALFLNCYELQDDILKPLSKQAIFRKNDGAFSIQPEGNAPAVIQSELPEDIQRAIMAFQAIGGFKVFPENYAPWKQRLKKLHGGKVTAGNGANRA